MKTPRIIKWTGRVTGRAAKWSGEQLLAILLIGLFWCGFVGFGFGLSWVSGQAVSRALPIPAPKNYVESMTLGMLSSFARRVFLSWQATG